MTPQFIERDPEAIVQEMIAFYENATGKTLQPAQVERLLINSFAYRESLVREKIQAAALQNLVAFSSAPVLDYLGELVGVVRLAAQPASCTMEFTLSANPLGVVIPQGTRIASVDGRVVFATVEQVDVNPTILTATVKAECQTDGTVGNGYGVGTITNILDPQAFIASAENTNTTAGGSDIEDDEQLRQRIRLAPDSFSVAGSEGAYIYWAKTANPNIIDVAITSPVPGTVNIYPLMADGSVTPSQILQAVFDICNGRKVRPLTDTVQVIAPTAVTYAITCNVVIYDTADSTTVQAQIQQALDAYVLAKRKKLGQDVTLSQLVMAATVDGVYEASFSGFSTLVVAPNGFAKCTSVSVNITGTTAG